MREHQDLIESNCSVYVLKGELRVRIIKELNHRLNQITGNITLVTSKVIERTEFDSLNKPEETLKRTNSTIVKFLALKQYLCKFLHALMFNYYSIINHFLYLNIWIFFYIIFIKIMCMYATFLYNLNIIFIL